MERQKKDLRQSETFEYNHSNKKTKRPTLKNRLSK